MCIPHRAMGSKDNGYVKETKLKKHIQKPSKQILEKGDPDFVDERTSSYKPKKKGFFLMTFSRRNFLKAGFLSSAVFLMDGCSLFGVTTPIKTFALLHHDLFPYAQELGIQTAPYMQIVFHHSRISEADKTFFKKRCKMAK